MGLSMLSIEGLKVAYGHVEALRGIDMAIKQGEITAIIGSNGAGKTSALMAISGLAPVTAGEAWLPHGRGPESRSVGTQVDGVLTRGLDSVTLALSW